LAANRKGAWLRDTPAWCPICACEDVAARGEVYARQSWGVGAYLICASHGCLLVSECPRCFSRASYQPVQGRLRLWCDRCASAADTALEPRLIPFWPFGAPQQRRRCRPVSLADDARPVLLRVQRTQLSALTGKPVRAPWTRQLKATEVTETLRRLCFIMLGPLWEDAGRPPLVRDGDDNNDRLPDDWTPGSLPAFIAAPALLAAVSFLAAESGRPLAGMTWNQRVLLDGEKAAITAETLPWHLSFHDAALARTLLRPGAEPFVLLLSALRGDRNGLGATREERRRRYGVGAVERQRKQTAQARLAESEWSRDARERRAHCNPPSERYALHRLMPGGGAPKPPSAMSNDWKAAVAVLATLGANATDGDIVHRCGWSGTLIESRYVQYWVTRNSHHGAAELTALLAEAVEHARAEDRGLLLPELEPKPIARPWGDTRSN
jgi:hypothetical protein